MEKHDIDLRLAGIDDEISELERELEREKRQLFQPDGSYTNGGFISTGPAARESGPRGPATDKSYRGMFYPGETRKLDLGGFKDANEFLTVLETQRYDPRLTRAMSEGISSDGGFSVPEELAAKWLDSSLPSEIVRPRATVWPMKTATRKVPGWNGANRTGGSLFGGLELEWLAESGEGTERSAKLRLIELQAKKGAVFCQSSNELAADGLSFEAQLESALISTVGYGLDASFLSGTGSGQPQGVLTNPALITVAKETGQTAGTICYENVKKMYAQMYPGGRKRGVWLANDDALPELLQLEIAIGLGGDHVPLMKEDSGAFSIFGRPVVLTEHMATVGSAKDIAFVDFSQYAIGVRKEITLDKSIIPGWSTDEMSYRVIVRVDGMGTWSEAITPKNGNSLSWVVTLAERA